MTTDTPDDAVPVAELRELAADWRGELPSTEGYRYRHGRADGLGEAADELEALCADVEGDE